jgi:hypothetical protein
LTQEQPQQPRADRFRFASVERENGSPAGGSTAGRGGWSATNAAVAHGRDPSLRAVLRISDGPAAGSARSSGASADGLPSILEPAECGVRRHLCNGGRPLTARGIRRYTARHMSRALGGPDRDDRSADLHGRAGSRAAAGVGSLPFWIRFGESRRLSGVVLIKRERPRTLPYGCG